MEIKYTKNRILIYTKSEILKVPIFWRGKTLFHEGLKANRIEHARSGLRDCLAPVKWTSRLKWIIAMDLIEPIGKRLTTIQLRSYVWDMYNKDGLWNWIDKDCVKSNWGYLDGKLVKLNYGD